MFQMFIPVTWLEARCLISGAVGQNLLGERIHATARFPRSDCAEDGNAGEQTPLGDHEPLRVFRRDLFAGIVNLPDNEE